MKNLSLSPKISISLSVAAIAALFLIVAPSAAMAATAGSDELGIGGHITSLLSVVTGPIAKLIAAIMVILGIILMSRGHDMGEGVKTIGTIALGVGVLIGLGNILKMVGSSASDASSGSLIPVLATHAAIVSHHAALLGSVLK